ncbi:helix-turn-helix domain-containing protein [Streptococcus pneumoniae]
MNINLHERTSEKEIEGLSRFPSFGLRCRLKQLLKERGMKMWELHVLTGIRQSALSELANTTRSTINVSHVTAVALALRITDLNELFEFGMDEDTREQFKKDQKEIDKKGILSDQEAYLWEVSRKDRKPRKKPTDQK